MCIVTVSKTALHCKSFTALIWVSNLDQSFLPVCNIRLRTEVFMTWCVSKCLKDHVPSATQKHKALNKTYTRNTQWVSLRHSWSKKKKKETKRKQAQTSNKNWKRIHFKKSKCNLLVHLASFAFTCVRAIYLHNLKNVSYISALYTHFIVFSQSYFNICTFYWFFFCCLRACFLLSFKCNQ